MCGLFPYSPAVAMSMGARPQGVVPPRSLSRIPRKFGGLYETGLTTTYDIVYKDEGLAGIRRTMGSLSIVLVPARADPYGIRCGLRISSFNSSSCKSLSRLTLPVTSGTRG